jgi:hypothetical protein
MEVNAVPKPRDADSGPCPEQLDRNPGAAMSRERDEILDAVCAFPLESRAGGSCRDWFLFLRRDFGDPLSEASEPLRRIFEFCKEENRADRLVNRLIGIERAVQKELLREKAATETLVNENRFIRRMLDDRDRQYAELQVELVAMRRDWAWRAIRMLRRRLGRLCRLYQAGGCLRQGEPTERIGSPLPLRRARENNGATVPIAMPQAGP